MAQRSQHALSIRRIGIALAAYQPDPRIFAEQLKSIQAQSFGDWVCAITIDSPLEPLRSEPALQAFFSDPRFVWSANLTRLGHKKNFERAIGLAAAQAVDAIACSDQDDVWYQEKLAASAEALSNAGHLSLVHCDMHLLEAGGNIGPETAWQIEKRGVHNSRPRDLLIRNVVAGCASLFDAELARRYPAIPEAAEFHDHWYALAAACFGGVHPIARPLFAYRQHGENVVGVSPFHGVFWVPERSRSAKALAEKMRAGWEKSRRLALAALAAGLPLGARDRLIFTSRWDLGLGILLQGLGHAGDDPALMRACLARGGGKLLSGGG